MWPGQCYDARAMPAITDPTTIRAPTARRRRTGGDHAPRSREIGQVIEGQLAEAKGRPRIAAPLYGTISLRNWFICSRPTLVEVQGTLAHFAGTKSVAGGAPSQARGARETQRCRCRVAATSGPNRSRYGCSWRSWRRRSFRRWLLGSDLSESGLLGRVFATRTNDFANLSYALQKSRATGES
jgi:hypothetical protein